MKLCGRFLTIFIQCCVCSVGSDLSRLVYTAVRGVQVGNDCNETIHLVALLPSNVRYLPSIQNVWPGLKLAMDKIVEQQILSRFRIQLSYRDSNCSNVYAPKEAVESYKENRVNVFLGPSCEFALGKISIFIR